MRQNMFFNKHNKYVNDIFFFKDFKKFLLHLEFTITGTAYTISILYNVDPANVVPMPEILEHRQG